MNDLTDRIRNVRFKPVRIREGYDMGEVEQFLSEFGPRPVPEPDPQGSVVEESRGLFGRLFGR